MKRKIICAAVCLSVMLTAASCGSKSVANENNTAADVSVTNTETYPLADVTKFDISSNDLHDGVWDSVITNTENGANKSPQLSWEPVEGASSYVVYMVDTTANNWLHWRSENLTVTSLEQGSAPAEQYIGPYPPSGTHTYEIYVYALKEPSDKIPGALDCPTDNFENFEVYLNDQGTVLAYGHIAGTYTHGV